MANLELDPVLGGREQEHVQVLKGVVVVTIACLYPAQLRQFLSRTDSHFADSSVHRDTMRKSFPLKALKLKLLSKNPNSPGRAVVNDCWNRTSAEVRVLAGVL